MKNIFLFLFISISIFSCKNDSEDEELPPPTVDEGINSSTNVKGYNLLSKINGIWSGDVTSSTALGNYQDWAMDIRPMSAAQTGGKSELDSINDIFMSFFIVKHNNEYRLAFRNGGGFGGQQRISYQICDSVYESASVSYYRFSDFVAGENRVYAAFTFENDSMNLKVYTSVYNTVSPVTIHMHWKAKKLDSLETQDAVTHFSFPQKQMVKDFSTTFSSMTESIFYNVSADAYPETTHPYVGETEINISYAGSLTINPGSKSFVIFTTQPLFSGFTYVPANLKYRTRYVILDATDLDYTFKLMHPDNYYAYVIHDANGDGIIGSGDYINSPLSPITFTLNPDSQTTVNVNVNFTIP
jgi:hypothetical protein